MNETQDPRLAGADDRTQAFSLISPDATIPNLSLNDQKGIAELVIVRGPQSGEVFVLDIPEITIGRDPSCEVFLNDRTVSRRHAHLSLRDGKAFVEDLGSLNGTWVDGRHRVLRRAPQRLEPADRHVQDGPEHPQEVAHGNE